MGEGSEIRLPDTGVVDQFRTGALTGDSTTIHDAGGAGEFERSHHILLNHEDRETLSVELDERIDQLFNEQRREPERELVDHQKSGGTHESTANGAHLLFTPRHGPCSLMAALGQFREYRVDAVNALSLIHI